MTTFGLAVISDGRTNYLRQCLASLMAETGWRTKVDPFAFTVIVDDSGFGTAHDTVDSLFDISVVHAERQGLCQAVNTAWAEAAKADVDFLFHVEEDFVMERAVELSAMAFVLEECEYLAEMVLCRQPWSPEEQLAGGIVPLYRDRYEGHQLGDARWLETDWLFSLNPALIPRSVFAGGFDDRAERGQTDKLVAEGWRFGLWGVEDDPPRVTHIGAQRSAGWKL